MSPARRALAPVALAEAGVFPSAGVGMVTGECWSQSWVLAGDGQERGAIMKPDRDVGMPLTRRLALAALGLLAGIVATLVMILLMAGARTWLGLHHHASPRALPPLGRR